ncbi:MAG: rhomboid family intramembrane serine protease [Rhodospirillum sp.]|nr:rhomboid family intramembrane serine protease [Rhodospirillum sp.]MCF8487662.1 rhomboid family intramembrane serine protease [Rhodospirillum sp.]MCF8500407.1 rhomboid family intramembrane serine protease [Rhodospirillum sp.]
MLPLHDDNPTTVRPVVTIGLIFVCLAVFLYQSQLSERESRDILLSHGFVPLRLFLDFPGDGPFPPPSLVTLLTSAFLHGGWLHVLGNMLVLWVFGNNVEDAMGHGRFLVFYLLCGAAAAFFHGLSATQSVVPMVGASGAISGVMGAYILLYPRARILCWAWILVLRLPAMVFLGIWFGLQVVSALGDGNGSVAWWAHVGGFLVGMALLIPFKRRGVALFRARSTEGPGLRTAALGLGRRGMGPPPTGALAGRMPMVSLRVHRSRIRFPESGHSPKRKGPWS